MESFWSFAESRLGKLHGIRKQVFCLHLKECKFRFDHRDAELYKELLTEFRADPAQLVKLP